MDQKQLAAENDALKAELTNALRLLHQHCHTLAEINRLIHKAGAPSNGSLIERVQYITQLLD
jgi:SOS response regulatory protein OraA/RecX